MTLGVAIEAKNGIVLASDGRATFGDPRGLTVVNDTVNKIFKPSQRSAIAMSGAAEIGNSLMRSITQALTISPVTDVDAVAEVIRNQGIQNFNKWFGNPMWLMGPAGPINTPRPDVWYLLAGYSADGQPRIINQASAPQLNFAPNVSTTGFAAIGVVTLTIYLLNRLYRRGLDLDIAKDLAAYCILETASQDGKVGGPMAMAVVRPNADTEIIGDDEIAELAKRVDQHREALRTSFLTLPKAPAAQPAAQNPPAAKPAAGKKAAP